MRSFWYGVIGVLASTTAHGREPAGYYYNQGRRIVLEASATEVAVSWAAGAKPAGLPRAAAGARSDRLHGQSLKPEQELIRYRDGAERDRALLELRSNDGVRAAHPVLYHQHSSWGLILGDQVVARFASELDAAAIEARLRAAGLSRVAPIPALPNAWLLRTSGPRASALEAANRLYELGGALYSHPNFVKSQLPRRAPNDPLYGSQWHLNSTGQGGARPGADINAPAAWDRTVGCSNIIAIADDGVEYSHEDLAGKTVAGKDYCDGDSNPAPQGEDAHGHACAGVAAAKGNNGVGVTGASWDSRIMGIRGPASCGLFESEEADIFIFAANQGADIISNSWGPPDDGGFYPLPDVTRDGIHYARVNGRGGKGSVVLFAAGNGNESVSNDGYASNPDVIAVAASDDQDNRAFYSDFGPEIDVCAPSNGGVTSGIITTDRTGADGYSPTAYTDDFGGTSSACPLVAGVAALVLCTNPNLTAAQVQSVLQNTTVKIPGNEGFCGYSGGFSPCFGYGKVDAAAAVDSAAGGGGGGGGGGGQLDFRALLSPNPVDEGENQQISVTLTNLGATVSADLYLVLIFDGGGTPVSIVFTGAGFDLVDGIVPVVSGFSIPSGTNITNFPLLEVFYTGTGTGTWYAGATQPGTFNILALNATPLVIE